jgi:tetratricopeptide (TPR) repeat protein
MVIRILKATVFVLAVGCAALLPERLSAQAQTQAPALPSDYRGGAYFGERTVLDLYIQGPNGAAIEGAALVTLTQMNGQIYVQMTAKAGYLQLSDVPPTEYKVLVVAPGFEKATKEIDANSRGAGLVKVAIQLQPATDGEDTITDLELTSLSPKAQKAIAKAIEALRLNKLPDARNQLETASRFAPKSAEVDYLYGVYSLQMKDRAQAMSYWTKALEVYPKHFRSLLSLSQALLDDNKLSDALVYLNRAVRVNPYSWRAHAIYASAYLRHGSPDEAIQQAQRALELGHGQAALVERYLAAALAKRGEKDKAVAVLQTYVQEHPSDNDAKKQLENLQLPAAQNAEGAAGAAGAEAIQPGTLGEATALPLPSSWMPPDVDEKVPPVEPGTTCALDEVVRKTGQRIEEFVRNVDRFTATELLTHESVNKWGMASSPEQRKFDYLVSVQEVAKGFLNVDEYRSNSNNSPGYFSDGVESNGLPAHVLIFHPYNVGSFEISCEGLAKWNGGLAWQVHFRQRSDRPNRIREYKLGMDGQSYPVAMKGRAWIAADTFQITRLETDLIAPIPQIRLAADHTAIEYAPVQFKNRKVDMWLPQTAEVYYDWRGKRVHMRHSFSKYLLFSVDDKQKIFAPKGAEETRQSP